MQVVKGGVVFHDQFEKNMGIVFVPFAYFFLIDKYMSIYCPKRLPLRSPTSNYGLDYVDTCMAYMGQ